MSRGQFKIFSYFFEAFFAVSDTALIFAFAVSAIAFTVESTFFAVESTALTVLSTADDTAESAFAAASLLPLPHEVKAVAITSTDRIFFIVVFFVAGKGMHFLQKLQDI
jgi:hypothetical protein